MSMSLGLSMSLSLMRGGRAAGGPSYDPDAEALFARMSTEPDATRKGLISDLIVSLKDGGVWSKLDCLYVTAAHDAQAARQNWIADLFNATTVNGPVFAVDRGYTGDGSSSYLSTGFTPSTAGGKYTQDSAHMGIYINTNVAEDTIDVGPASSGYNQIQTRTAAGHLAYRANTINGAARSVAGITTSVGHSAWSRTAAAAYAGYKDGTQVDSGTDVSSALSAQMLRYCAGIGTFSTKRVAALHWGAALTSTEIGDLESAIFTYLNAVGGS